MDFVFNSRIPVSFKNTICRKWLKKWQLANLDMLRDMSKEIAASKWCDEVTLLYHSFWVDEDDFNEFPVLHTWRMLGKFRTVIITDRIVPKMSLFQREHSGWVSIKQSSYLRAGDIFSLSLDCLNDLYKYFDTKYCLVVQDDGFPINDNLGDFLHKWDYIGAPCVRNIIRQYIADFLLMDCLNGGFSLRSHKLCVATSSEWKKWGQFFQPIMRWPIAEDWFFSVKSRLNPLHRLRFKWPWANTARRFSVMDLVGGIDVRNFEFLPFGIHSPTTVYLYRMVLSSLGYEPVSLDGCWVKT